MRATLDPGVTGALLVEIKPIGQPGKVAITVRSVGPVPLSTPEAIGTLRQALAALELQASQERS